MADDQHDLLAERATLVEPGTDEHAPNAAPLMSGVTGHGRKSAAGIFLVSVSMNSRLNRM
jgi:hypothetical protein